MSDIKLASFWGPGVIMAFAVGLVLGFAMTQSYINKAITNFEQTLKIVSPVLSQSERLEAESRFARMRTRQDYVDLLATLNQDAKRGALEIPGFEPW